MAFSYDPNDAPDDGPQFDAWPAGMYEAVIVSAEDGVSKSSNQPMLTITFEVYDGQKKQKCWEYVVKKTTWKLRQIAKALDKLDDFEAGVFDVAKHVNANIMVDLTIEADNKGKDRNRIYGYAPTEGGATFASAVGTHEPIDEDDIPF